MNAIFEMLSRCAGPDTVMPPTALYNEGWMLRLVLNWFAAHPGLDHPLGFQPNARWYSEALLPSQFAARKRGDDKAESYTHADGVIGHFDTRPRRGDLSLRPDATQLVVTEAKMYSGLSSGTTRAKNFDQAARNVACIAHMLSESKLHPDKFSKLAFFVIAPQSQFNDGVFGKLLDKPEIEVKVRNRCEMYEGEKEDWFDEWFAPTLAKLEIQFKSWESLCTEITHYDQVSGDELSKFYSDCVRFNRRPFASNSI